MNYKLFNLAEEKLLNNCFADALKIVFDELKKAPGSKLWITFMMRVILKMNSPEYISEMTGSIKDFIDDRVNSGKETISVWPILSKANRLIMRDSLKKNAVFFENVKNFKSLKREKIKLLMLTCVWQREELTVEFYKYYQRVKNIISEDIDLDILVVGSEGDQSRKLCEQFSFNYIEHENQPLTGKWQAGVDFAERFDFDALIIMGSDDFVEPSVFYLYKDMIKANVLFFGFLDLYLYDYKSGKSAYWRGYGSASGGLNQPARVGETIGLGRMLSRNLLEYLNFDLWRGVIANKSLDGLMKKRIQSETGMLPVATGDSLPIIVGDEVYHIGQVATTFLHEKKIGLDIKHANNVTDFAKYKVSNDSFTFLNKEEFEKFPIKVLKYSENNISVNLNCLDSENKKNISVAVGIPTFNRAEMLDSLLKQLFSQAEKNNILLSIFVYDDCSVNPFNISTLPIKYQKLVSFYRSNVNNGKKNYWRVVNHIFEELNRCDANYYFYLPDDVNISDNFFGNSISCWDSIKSEKKITVNLLNDGRDECWTKFKRVIESNSKFELYRSQWFDMAMIFDKQLLRYRVKEIPASFWDKNPLLSSGVGAQLSKRLHAAGYEMYQVKDSLIFHGVHQSQMNPEERARSPLLAIENKDSVNERFEETKGNTKNNFDNFQSSIFLKNNEFYEVNSRNIKINISDFFEELSKYLSSVDFVVVCNSYPNDNNRYGGEFIRSRTEKYFKNGLVGLVVEINKTNDKTDPYFDQQLSAKVLRIGLQHMEGVVRCLIDFDKTVFAHSPLPKFQNLVNNSPKSKNFVFFFHGFEVRKIQRLHFNYSEDELIKNKEKFDFINNDRFNAASKSFLNENIKKVFVSNFLLEMAVQDVGVFPKNYVIVNNYIDTVRYEARVRKEEEVFNILMIKNFSRKNYGGDIAIEALKKISAEPFFSKLKITIIGFGELFSESVKPLLKFNNVFISEKYCTSDEMKELFESNTIFLTPTRHDTQGVTMCEAMSSGMICITTAITGIPEFIDSDSGLLLQSNDSSAYAKAIYNAVHSPSFIPEMSINAAKRIRAQCSSDFTVAKEIELIIEINKCN